MTEQATGSWMKELAADEEWKGAVGTLVLVCADGHRWGAWPKAVGTRCIADVDDSRYTNGLCGEELVDESGWNYKKPFIPDPDAGI